MRYPFLEHNQLILIDYLPGSSGQLLMRLWYELDHKMAYDNPCIMSDRGITDHPASREIDWDVIIPKRLTNWFLDRCEPQSTDDYLQYFEFLGTAMMALKQPWIRGDQGPKFYEHRHWQLQDQRLLHGIHTQDHEMPWADMRARAPGLRAIKLVPQTERGLRYQLMRWELCYPKTQRKIPLSHTIGLFNSQDDHSERFDLCTALVDRDTDSIVAWLTAQLGTDLRTHKLDQVREMLQEYYSAILDHMDV